MIQFYLDTRLIKIQDLPPDYTVLDWLRIHQGRTGTKEGCASGDCGACTVVVASVKDSLEGPPKLEYQTINSCITFIGALHGKQLITVESLANKQALHPVQQAMVEEHGSQCGFCTPGFIMSMFCLSEQSVETDQCHLRVDQALGGNLCRCTGYRPIKTAMFKVLDQVEKTVRYKANHPTFKDEEQTVQRLLALGSQPLEDANYHQPTRLDELVALIDRFPHAELIAGGTDLALKVTQQFSDIPTLISVSEVAELKRISVQNDEITLGAAVTLTECLKIVRTYYPSAEELILRFGSDQIRNQGTVGGNIGSASPIGDLSPLFIALGAKLVLQQGVEEREIDLESHFIDYKKTTLQEQEFIKYVRLPLLSKNDSLSVYKVSKRHDDDISTVCLAACLTRVDHVVSRARLAYGGMAAIPKRAYSAEMALTGHPVSLEIISKVQQAIEDDFKPITDARASANYRMQVAKNLINKALFQQGDSL